MAYFYDQNQLKMGTSPEAPENAVAIATLVQGKIEPVYIYDIDNITKRFQLLKSELENGGGGRDFRQSIHFAMKANSNKHVLQALRDLGAGVDTVSAGEVRIALENGFSPSKIIFSGVAKTEREIEFALINKIKQINVESPQELRRIAKVAARLNVRADVAFRMNPDVNPKTHPYITTGFRENKFGMDESFLPELVEILRGETNTLHLRGLTQHIGSQLFGLDVMQEAILKTINVHHELEKQGFKLDRLDVGGGIGIHYETHDESEEFDMIRLYGRMVREAIQGLDVELLTEPGRILVGRSGILVGEVQYIKKAPAKTFAILDTGMHHLLRPALYQAKHRVLPLHLEPSKEERAYDIVGPICESSDVIAKDISIAGLKEGDRLAIADAGAYGFVMASRYNAHELPEEIAVSNGAVL